MTVPIATGLPALLILFALGSPAVAAEPKTGTVRFDPTDDAKAGCQLFDGPAGGGHPREVGDAIVADDEKQAAAISCPGNIS